MAGNAVPVPLGHFVMSATETVAPMSGIRTAFGVVAPSGILEDRLAWVIDHKEAPLATNLIDFVDPRAEETLSAQAAAGLIVRSARSGHPMPRELFEILARLAVNRTAKLKPSRGNSFDALDSMQDAVAIYRESLPGMAEYKVSTENTDDLEFDSDDESADE